MQFIKEISMREKIEDKGEIEEAEAIEVKEDKEEEEDEVVIEEEKEETENLKITAKEEKEEIEVKKRSMLINRRGNNLIIKKF